MLKNLLFLALLLLSLAVKAQTVAMDSTFSSDGWLQSSVLTNQFQYTQSFDVSPQGNMIVVGNHPNIFGSTATIYNAVGDSLAHFGFKNPNNSTSHRAKAIQVLEDGKILMDDNLFGVCRFSADGHVDSTFGTQGCTGQIGINVYDITSSPEGKIYVAGTNSVSGLGNVGVLALLPDGTPDSSFNGNGRFYDASAPYELLLRVEVKPNGGVMAEGFILDNIRSAILISLTPDGKLDSTFGINGVLRDTMSGFSEGYGLAFQPDGKVLMSGYIYTPYQATVTRFLPDGNRDSTFGTNSVAYIPAFSETEDIILQPDGKITAYGFRDGTASDPTRLSGLFQLMPDGTLDTSFGNNGVFYSPVVGNTPPMVLRKIGEHRYAGCGGKEYYHPGVGIYYYLMVQQFIIDLNLGVLNPAEQKDATEVLLYPNPVAENPVISFQIEQEARLQVELSDLNGSLRQILIPERSFPGGEHDLSLTLPEGLHSGYYAIALIVNGKLVKSLRFFRA